MHNSRAYYGSTFLEKEDLAETNINNRIELEYYATKYCKNKKDDKLKYGIEVIKKEYHDNQINTESSNIQNISKNKDKVIEIINTLIKYKVTPIGLKDVLDDLLKKDY